MKQLIFKYSIALAISFSGTANAFQLSISELAIPENKTFEIPKGTTKIAFSKLELGKGSSLIVPEDVTNIEITVDNAIFSDNSSILQQAQNGSNATRPGQTGEPGSSGAEIKITVNHTTFAFSKFGDSELDPKFSVISRAGVGGKSGEGSPGGNAKTSNCGSVNNGHSASRGGTGTKGASGGRGGNIIAIFKLTKDHASISDKQIKLLSIGGLGGAGGEGGPGGSGSPEKCCAEVLGHCTWKRGSYPGAGRGDQGAQGPSGESGLVDLKFQFEH